MLEYGTIECRTLKCETECWTLERRTENGSTYIVYITVSPNTYHKAYNIEYIEYTSNNEDRTNNENSVQVGLFAISLIHWFSFVYSNSKK